MFAALLLALAGPPELPPVVDAMESVDEIQWRLDLQRASLWQSMQEIPTVVQPLVSVRGRFGRVALGGGLANGGALQCEGASVSCLESNRVQLALMWTLPRIPVTLFAGLELGTVATKDHGMSSYRMLGGGIQIPLSWPPRWLRRR